MIETIDGNQSIKIIKAMAQAIARQQDHLSALDSTVGDGDHGHNLAKALARAGQQVNDLDKPTLDTVWRTGGRTAWREKAPEADHLERYERQF